MKEKCGTHGYMAPELHGKTKECRVTTAIDLYAFGIILYELSVAYKPAQVKAVRPSYSNEQEINFRDRDWRRFAQ